MGKQNKRPVKNNNAKGEKAPALKIDSNSIPSNSIIFSSGNVIKNIHGKGDKAEPTIFSAGDIIINYSEPIEQPADIFISYARTDVEIVQRIYESIINKEHHPWMDIYSIKAGEDWQRAINDAIEKCEMFLAILSNNSVSRRGVIQKELKKALDKWEEMLPGDIYLIPIRIDDCTIPDSLKHIHALDWDNGKGENKLLEAIRVGLARRKADG